MHFTEPISRHPYWPAWPLIEVTHGCSHNSCRFCTLYRDVKFGVQSMEIIEQDLAEIARTDPHATTIQLLSGNPLVLPYKKLAPVLEKIDENLPELKHIYAQGRITDIKGKTVEELRRLRELGLNEISLGIESGDDWTLDRIGKGYHAADIVAQCAKLDEVGLCTG